MCLTAAISFERVVGFQLMEGAMDSVLFEKFLFDILTSIRRDPLRKHKHIVVYLDNARPHVTERIHALAAKFDATFLFAAQYSPFLQPIEFLFGELKA